MPSKGFSTNKRTLIGSVAAGGLALLAAAVFLWPSDPADRVPLPPRRVQSDGETVGWVSKLEGSTIHVNSGPFGGGVVALVVTRNTRITIPAAVRSPEPVRNSDRGETTDGSDAVDWLLKNRN